MDAYETLGKKIDSFFDLAKETYKAIEQDFLKLVEIGEEKIDGLIDKVTEDDYLRDIGSTVVREGKEGIKTVKDTLKEKAEQYDAKMNKAVKTEDGVGKVGFWDGFIDAYLGTNTDRRPKSQVYSTHKMYGKAIGFASAAALFLMRGKVPKLIGSLPVVTRGAKYLHQKVTEAKKTVDSKAKATSS